jgi:uncharacterized protein (TIGR01244 family)
MRRTLAVTLALAAAGAVAGAAPPETVDASLVPNYVLVKPNVAVAGQPTAAGFAALKQMGFRTVVNLRPEDEPGVAGEKAAVEALGLRYVHVPLTAATVARKDVDAVAGILADSAAGPVLIHCHSANRAGGMWALAGLKEGGDVEAAIAEGKRAGLRSDAMIEAVRRIAAPAPAKTPD